MKKKIFYILTSILIILIITNPGDSSFMGFLDEAEFSNAGRKANYIVCSVYSVDFVTADSGHMHQDYFAMLGRFYKIN